jgi:hypothetical protein
MKRFDPEELPWYDDAYFDGIDIIIDQEILDAWEDEDEDAI